MRRHTARRHGAFECPVRAGSAAEVLTVFSQIPMGEMRPRMTIFPPGRVQAG